MIIPSTFKVIREIQKNRTKKRRSLLKMAIGTLVDRTMLIYLSFFFIVILLFVRDFLVQYQQLFLAFEAFFWTAPLNIMFLGLIRPFIHSSTRPGVMFTSSDLLLSLLPYRKEQIWCFHALVRIKKYTRSLLAIGAIIYLVTPLSMPLILSLIIGFILLDALMIIPQWLIFHLPWYLKWIIGQGTMLIVVAVQITFIKLQLPNLLWLVIFLGVALINLSGYRLVVNQSNWSMVAQVNDRILWNIPIVGFASKVTMEPIKRRGFYYHLVRNKRLRKPFNHNKKYQSYHRLIYFMFSEQKEPLFKMWLGMIAILVILLIQSTASFGFAVAITMVLYSQIMTSFFDVLFKEKLLYILPWRINDWRVAFFRWLWSGLLIWTLITSIPAFFIITSRLWLVIHMVAYLCVGYFFISEQLTHHCRVLIKSKVTQPIWTSLLAVLMFFGVIYSIKFPIISIAIIIFAILRYTYLNYIVNRRDKYGSRKETI
ncbi:hypothetical protein [Amphibacillus sediminis]|uniref:hypothetical protein n=1 Tax=Amphibacillus sediminis TaxID=360185 RepID=UPI000836FFA2|nr:hypothetical protein [Amphibacillus sediminis]